MSLKKPFEKCKRRKEFEKALSRIEKVLVINRKWPRSIQDTIRRSVAVNFAERPTMSDVCNVINCLVVELEDGAFESAATPTLKKSTSFALPSRLPSKGVLRRRLSFTSAVPATPPERSGTLSTICTFEDFLLQQEAESAKQNQE
eukprot:scaffold31074_cov166-Skeletonema_menzelii.AAC.1